MTPTLHLQKVEKKKAGKDPVTGKRAVAGRYSVQYEGKVIATSEWANTVGAILGFHSVLAQLHKRFPVFKLWWRDAYGDKITQTYKRP
jgi:hypothetical protein